MPQKTIALTFDDGPHPETTVPLLDILAESGVTASFFVVGENLTPETEPVVRRAFDMGCEICSHSLTHSDMTAFTPAQIRQEMDETARRIIRVTGQAPRFFRPPYIAVNETMWQTVPLPFIAGYGVRDYDDAVSEDARVAGVLQKARDGAVAIVGEDNALLGIFTDGDFRRAMTRDDNVLHAPIESVMTPNPISINQNKLAVEILKILENRKIDDIAAIDDDGRFVGLVDIQDLPKFKVM